MQHLCAFYKEFDSLAPVPLDTVTDDVLVRPSADRFQVPAALNALAWAAANGVNIRSPSIRSASLEARKMSIDIIPYYRGGNEWPKEAPHVFFPKVDFVLDPLENFQLYAGEDGVGATIVRALVSLKAPGPLAAMPAGDIRVIKATVSAVMTENVWTTINPVFERPLQPGTYVLVGFIAIADTVAAFRVIFKDQAWRPGVLGISDLPQDGLYHASDFFDGLMWYPMGTFTDINPPQFQAFAWAACGTATLVLYAVKIA